MKTVVIRHHADVTAVNAVWRPGAAFLRCFMQEKFGAREREWCFIIFQGSVEERFGQEIWVDPQGEKKIKNCGGKRNKVAPQMHGKVGMDTAKSGEKVILEYANRLFCRICAMDVVQDELKINIVVAQVFF